MNRKLRKFFNDNEPYVAEWLSNLHPCATVDHRGIEQLTPANLAGYDRVHLFAGIGGWDYALDLAGWGGGWGPVWTGSCPCQPFSSAGKRGGTNDSRHLWPHMFRLIRECRPVTVFGEQVEGPLGRGWLDGVFADLEGEGYTCGAAVLGAHSVGAPHQRNRIYWVAVSKHDGLYRADGSAGQQDGDRQDGRLYSGSIGGVAHTELGPPERQRFQVAGETSSTEGSARQWERFRDDAGNGSIAGGVAHTERHPSDPWRPSDQPTEGTGASLSRSHVELGRRGDAYWINCLDGKARRTQPGIQPLAYGVPARVAKLRAIGNAIVPQVAATFIRAFMDSVKEHS